MRPTRYPIPAATTRAETTVLGSRFIATAAHAATIEEAEAFVASIRAEFAGATHHCVAYRVGYGPGAAERASDDGEPGGTAGRPMIAVLQGQDIGDIAVVVTRYFGGVKLGTGGLVRAYSGAVRSVLAELPVTVKVERTRRAVETGYPRYETLRRFILDHEGDIQDEAFAVTIIVTFTLPVDRVDTFEAALVQWSNGQLHSVAVEQEDVHGPEG